MNDGEDLAMTWGNLETKYCGEVISDGVQMWTKTGDMDEPNDVQERLGKNNGKTNDLTETWNMKNLKSEQKNQELKNQTEVTLSCTPALHFFIHVQSYEAFLPLSG